MELTLDHVARLPRPGMAVPGSARFSRDGRLLAYLRSTDGSMRRVLWLRDVTSGADRVLFDPGDGVSEDTVSAEEALRRERARQLHTGVTEFAWAEHADEIVVPILGDVWVVPVAGEPRLVATDTLDPRLSPDGTRVAFVRDGDLWVREIGSGETRLTHDAADGITSGLADYIAQEELHRFRGHWWSPDGRLIAFQRTDERHVPRFTIPDWGADEIAYEQPRYPFAGAANARVRLGVVAAAGGEPRWLDLGDSEYLARVDWRPDGQLVAQLLSRDQRTLDVRAYDPATGQHTTLLVETSEFWINLHDDLRFCDDGSFVWSTESSGIRQLELRGADGALVRQLTPDPWPVDAVAGLDPQGRRVGYVAATSPVEAHVYVVSLDGGAPEQITQRAGMNAVVFSPDLSVHVLTHHSLIDAPSVRVGGAAGGSIHEPEPLELDLPVPELFTFLARDGEELHGILYRPERTPAPLIVAAYGGPGMQMVGNSWVNRVALRAQHLAAQGYAVISVDNRGTPRRGLMFEAPLLGRMGTIEVDDQTDGVRFAQAQGWADERVGIYGWSYGGYLTLMCMLREPDVFRAGVAGAPVTEWEGYDTGYTERYMGTPQDNPDGYREASVLTHAANLRGELLVIHGLIDENVHARHTMRFLDRLVKVNRRAQVLLYPQERHSPRSEEHRRSMEERIDEHFRASL